MPVVPVEELPHAFRTHLSDRDLQRNSTLQSFSALRPQLDRLQTIASDIDIIVDVGCGRGGFATALGEYLDADRVYGIEIDDRLREAAAGRGIETIDIDIEHDRIPISNGDVDLVVSFGLIEHLRYYDHFFREVCRILNQSGWLWLSAPNLGSWINRIAVLGGYQPRNVEVSQERATGVLPVYDRSNTLNHIHTLTYRALIDLLEHYKFAIKETAALAPYQRTWIDRVIDYIAKYWVGIGRRIVILASRSPA